MSLPVAHVLVGSAVLAAAGPRVDFCRRRTAWLLALTLPVLPDVDFAPVWFLGWSNAVWHRTFTHSVTFAVACGLVAAAVVAQRRVGSPRWAFVFVAGLVLSHPLVDMLGRGGHGGPGRGVLLFWPFSSEYWRSPWEFLPAGVRFSVGALLRTAAIELAVFGPPAALVAWLARRRRS